MTSSDVIPAFAPSMVDVRLLGVVTVSVSGQLVSLTHNEQLLVAALFGIAGRPISADSLIERIWDGSTPSRALHELVYKLRKSLDAAHPGASAVVMTLPNGIYKANLNPTQIDILRFRALLNEAVRLDQQGELPLAAERYRQALDQWEGDLTEPDEPLAGLAGREIASVRRGLKTGHLTALERLLDIELRHGRHTEAIPMLVQLATLHPYNERVTELQMRALCLAGQPTEAQLVYRELSTRLRQHTGGPSERVQQLHQRILKHDKALELPMSDDQPSGTADQPSYDPHEASADSDAAAAETGTTGDYRSGGVYISGGRVKARNIAGRDIVADRPRPKR